MSTLPVVEALRQPHHWWELGRYGVVGVGGYLISVVVFAAAASAGAGYILAASVAFAFALTNNFVWNRHWTFRAGHGHLGFQWLRFLVVNVAVFGFSLVVLHYLIRAGVSHVGAQAIAVALAAPPNYVGQKLWSFMT